MSTWGTSRMRTHVHRLTWANQNGPPPHLGTLESHCSRGLWEPLVPADSHPDLPEAGAKNLEARVPGAEVKLFLYTRINTRFVFCSRRQQAETLRRKSGKNNPFFTVVVGGGVSNREE